MPIAMLVLIILGIGLLLGGSLIARVVRGRGNDPVALARILQAVGIILLLAALFTRPKNLDTTAVPPPPDSPEMIGRE
jgi:hypothetical protein